MERRATVPWEVVARMAAVSIIGAAFIADIWLGLGPLSAVGAPTLLAQVVLASAGVLAMARPSWIVLLSVVAIVASLAMTNHAWSDGFGFTFFVDFAVLPLPFGVLLLHGGRVAWCVAACVVPTGAAVGSRLQNPPVSVIFSASILVGLALAAMAVAYVRLTDRERRSSVEFARQAERLELAREIHDVVGHHVTGIIVLAQGQQFASRSGAAGDDPAVGVLRAIEAAGVETMSSVRRLVGMLRDDEPAPSSLVDELEDLVEGLRTSHPHLDLVIDESVGTARVPAEIARAVHRVLREGLTNVRRHGDPGAVVAGAVRLVDDAVVIVVENGMTTGAGEHGFGLVGMSERVEALGGTFSSDAITPRQWRLCATLPLRATVSP